MTDASSPESTPAPGAMKILLAVDGGSHSTRAAEQLAKLAGVMTTPPDIILLHVDPPMVTRAMNVLGEEVTASLHAEASRAAIKPARGVLQRAGLQARDMALVDEPAEAIIAVARDEQRDLLVMGSHGRSALKSMFVGSVTAKVMAESDIPVLVVR